MTDFDVAIKHYEWAIRALHQANHLAQKALRLASLAEDLRDVNYKIVSAQNIWWAREREINAR